MSILGGTVSVRGVRVGSRKLLEEMNAFIERRDIHPNNGSRHIFNNAKDAFRPLLALGALWKNYHHDRDVVSPS
jgi:D-arabinose 1-dehydrogenase-like Zn-dependent alcohol dehydrogenase